MSFNSLAESKLKLDIPVISRALKPEGTEVREIETDKQSRDRLMRT